MLSTLVWSALWCVSCRAVPCWRARAVWFGGSLCRLVACCPALLFAPLVFFSVRSLCAVLFGAVLRFVAVPRVLCAMPSRSCVLLPGALLGCVLLYCGVVLCWRALCGFPRCFAVPVCGDLGRFRVVVCLLVLCCVLRFFAVLLLFVALSPVLARCPWVWRWRALWRFLWCVVLFLLVLCLVARLVRCCCVLFWRACFVLPCVVFRCRLVAGWCLVLLPFFWGSLVGLFAWCCLLVVCFGVGVVVWPRGPSPCRSAPWRGSLWCPVPRCCVLWCCAAVWCCAVGLSCPVSVAAGACFCSLLYKRLQNPKQNKLFFCF